MSPTFQELIDVGDYESLRKILRRHPNPEYRIEAARALSRLQEADSIEALIRSGLADNDDEVRNASIDALYQFLGKKEADLAISAYGTVDGVMSYEAGAADAQPISEEEDDPMDDENLDDSEPEPLSEEIADANIPGEFLDFSAEEKSIRWHPEEIDSLILILQDDTHLERQMKALRIIADHPSPAGIDALSMTALWSENLLVKNASYKALKKLYGDDTDRLLEEFRLARMAGDGDEDDDLYVEVEVPVSSQAKPEPSPYTQSPTTEPEGLGGRGLLFLLVIIFGIAAFLVYWLLLR